jgi:hypothetical protein
MPTPKPGEETQAEWMDRCIPVVMNDGSAESDQQAIAMCGNMWDEANGPMKSLDASIRRLNETLEKIRG